MGVQFFGVNQSPNIVDIESPQQLDEAVAELRRVAESTPFDYSKAVAEAKQKGSVPSLTSIRENKETKKVTTLSGQCDLDYMSQWTRFFKINGSLFQVVYYEFEGKQKMRQIQVVDIENSSREDALIILDKFIDPEGKDCLVPEDLPANVMVVIQPM